MKFWTPSRKERSQRADDLFAAYPGLASTLGSARAVTIDSSDGTTLAFQWNWKKEEEQEQEQEQKQEQEQEQNKCADWEKDDKVDTREKDQSFSGPQDFQSEKILSLVKIMAPESGWP